MQFILTHTFLRKMKKTSYIITLILLLIGFSACKNEDSFSELQKKEKKTIQNYIDINKIQVVKTMPLTWEPNVYYYTPSEFYIHILDEGDKSVSISSLSRPKVYFRTLEYYLDESKTTVSDKRNADEYPYPTMITYGDSYYASLLGTGLYEAIGYMKNLNSKARVIIPSYLNTSTYGDKLLPVGYDIEITVIE